MRARQRRRDASLAASNSVSTLVKDDIGQEIGVADDLACSLQSAEKPSY